MITQAINAPATGSLYRIKFAGTYLNNSGANRTLRLEVALDTTVLFTATSGNISANAATKVINGEILVFIVGTNSQRTNADVNLANTAGSATWANNNLTYAGVADSTVNVSSSKNLEVRWQHSLAATTITLELDYTVEKVNP
jgi:nitrous oxidase accessory protein NosD